MVFPVQCVYAPYVFYSPGEADNNVQIYDRKLPSDRWQYNLHRTLERARCAIQTEVHP